MPSTELSNYQESDDMRIPYSPKMVEMEKQIRPYLVVNGLEVSLSPDTPDEIIEMDKKLQAMFSEIESQMAIQTND